MFFAPARPPPQAFCLAFRKCPSPNGSKFLYEQFLYLFLGSQSAGRVTLRVSPKPFGHGKAERRRSALALAPLKGARQSLYAGEPVHRADSPLLILVVIFVSTIHDGAELPGNSDCALPLVSLYQKTWG